MPQPRERTFQDDVRETFATEPAKRVLHALMDRYGFLHPTTTPTDPTLIAYEQGQRSVVADLYHCIYPDKDELTPEQLAEMNQAARRAFPRNLATMNR